MEDVWNTVESAPQKIKKESIDKKPLTSRPRPISLKVPVAVQGSQESPGSEDFREETNTIIVFRHGAVVRLATSVSVGQFVVLTNRKSDQEALCAVVKVKSEPSTKDYVELQFSHPIEDFWDSPEHEPLQTESARVESPYDRSRSSEPQAPPASVPNSTSIVAEASPAVADGQNVAEQQTIHSENRAGSSACSMDSTASVADNSAPLRTAEIRGFGFWDASFPQEILSADETPRSSAQTGSPPLTVQGPQPAENQRLNPTLAAQHHRRVHPVKRVHSEVIEFRKDQKHEHVLIRADLVAKIKVAMAGVGLAAIFAIVGVATHSRHAAPVASPPAPLADTPAPANFQPDISLSETKSDVRERARSVSAPPSAEPRQGHTVVERSSRTPSTTESASAPAESSKPATPSQPAPASISAPAAQVAAIGDPLPLDLNPKSDNPEPVSRNLSMPVPAATPAIKLGGNAQEARLISSVPPVYPPLARSLGIQGAVIVRGIIEPSGQVTHMTVVSGPSVLRSAAIDAITKWKYAPEILDGKPAATEVNITVDFHIR